MPLHASLRQAATVIQQTIDHVPEKNVDQAINVIVNALQQKKPLLVCGNGGSASDAMHITGELVGRFLKERKGINCICLADNAAVLTAWANDYSYDTVFERQVEAYGQNGGVLLGLSTSGNSANVVNAFIKAKDMNLDTIALTGEGGGKLAAHADILLDVPSRHTPDIQQVHLCLYHYICEEIEARMA